MTNLVMGKVLSTGECEGILNTLQARLAHTLGKKQLRPETVMNACHRLVCELDEAYYLNIMAEFGIGHALGKAYLAEARQMFSKEALRKRMETELGQGFMQPKTFVPALSGQNTTEQILPLGVLLHIPAGNVSGLPIFSVLEGLLTGNINLLKLPSVDNGMTIRLLLALFEIEPALAEYVYVFDYSSSDIENMQKLLDLADGVVVWGGEEAIRALRKMIRPCTKIIEWGHKISFVYLTPKGISQENMEKIAHNIITTDQLLCSSCQGIFIDTPIMEEVLAFSKDFAAVLENAYRKGGKTYEIGIRAQNTTLVYTMELEKAMGGGPEVFKSGAGAVIAKTDSALEPAGQFGLVWVKRLGKKDIIPGLRPYKNYLQTVGLLCAGEEQAELAMLLSKTGAVKVCSPERMSATYENAPHDGEYPLRRYTKVFTVEGFSQKE